jgi:tetratricopeptide (TPR) repeat protein
MNDDGNEDSPPSVNALLGLALKLCDQLVSNDNKINDELYLLIKAIFELLKMQRREHNAIRFLQKVELLLKDLDLSYHDDDIDLKKRVILSWTQVSISDCYYAEGRYDEALNSFEQCIEDFKSIETLAPDPIIADCYLQIGRIHDAEKRLDQSLLAFEMAREIFSAYTNRQGTTCRPIIRKLLSSLGESKSYSVDGDIHEADTLKEIANVYFSMDDFDTAEIYYLKSLNICKAVYGSAHPKTARARWGIGICERGQGKIEKSITTHLEVADIFKKCLGSSHPDTADMEYNIAFLLNDKGDYESALVHFYSALSVYIKTYGHRHRHCGWTYHDIGNLKNIYIIIAIIMIIK